MPLRSPRFSGNPVLEACFETQRRMMAPEEGLPVKRVQAALIELGHSVGPNGADGIFGEASIAAMFNSFLTQAILYDIYCLML